MSSRDGNTSVPEILTPEQVAEYLQLPVDIVLSYLERGKIPGARFGNTWRIRRVTLDRWLDQQVPVVSGERKSPPSSQTTEPELPKDYSKSKPFSDQVASRYDIQKAGSTVATPSDQQALNERSTRDPSKPRDVNGQVSPGPATTESSLTQKPRRIQGEVKTFNPQTGYGFIHSDDGRDIFVHAVDVEDYGQHLRRGHRVEFEARRVPKGWQAYDVVIVKEGQPRKDRPAVRKVSTKIPKKAQIAFERALAAREFGDLKRARELFEEAIRQGAFLNVFQAYSAMEEKEDPRNAMRVLEKGIELFPDAGTLYNDYAMLKRRLGDLQGAADVLRRGLSAAPAFARQLHWSLATVLLDLGGEENLAEAAEHAKRAKELGQYLQDDPRYVKLQVLAGPRIGKEAWRFFEAAGFEIKPLSFGTQWADFLIRSGSSEYVETYDLRDWILVRCFYSPVNPSHLDAMQATLRTPPAKMRGLNQDIAFLVTGNMAPLRDALYRLMSDNGEAIVPLDLPSLEASCNEGPEKMLRSILDQWVSRRDLYRYNYPVSGRRFFGRELDLQRLMRDIDDGHNVGVFGLRKVGKTSLLHQLRELRPQDIIVYLDIQGIPAGNEDCSYLYWNIARRLCEECKAKKDALSLGDIVFQLGTKSDPPFQKRTARLFDHDIYAVLNRLEQLELPSRLVLILDEADRLLPAAGFSPGFGGYADFFAYLRGTSQNSGGRFVTVITAVNPALCEQAMWEGRDNPIFQFYHLMFLPPLTFEDCSEMIVKLGRGMGISYDDESLKSIFSATSGHPYLTRLLCSQINQLHPSRPLHVTPDMVLQAQDEFLRGEATPIFNEILERLETFFPIERDILLFIADGVDSEAELSELVQQPVDIALYHLIGYQLVEQTRGRYRIKINLLLSWLRRYHLGRRR
ncbi:MAG: cold shock domain-containing protein [Candidatus Methanomethyliaceae archaeon]